MSEPARVETFADRPAWLEARRQGIGASEAADVLGVGRKSPIALYAEKLGLVEPDPLEGEEIEWGHLLEPVLLQRYRKLTGREVAEPGGFSIYRSAAHPFMTFSPDGFVFDPQRGPGPLQIKNVGFYRADDWEDEPPLAYQIQVQHEIRVMGSQWGALAVLLGGNRFRHYEITRNEAFLDELVKREAEFWRCLQAQERPAVDGSDAARALLAKLHPRATPGLIVPLPVEAAEWDAQLVQAKADEKDAQARKQLYENQIKAALGDAEAGIMLNGALYTLKTKHNPGHTTGPYSYRELRRKDHP